MDAKLSEKISNIYREIEIAEVACLIGKISEGQKEIYITGLLLELANFYKTKGHRINRQK